MTLVAPDWSNLVGQYASSEEVDDRASAWRRKQLQDMYSQEPSVLLYATTDGSDEGQTRDRDLAVEQIGRRKENLHSQVIRDVLGRLDRQSRDRWETPTLRVTRMQKWEGRVLEVDDGIFTAELRPLGPGPDVIADFDTEDLLPEDRNLHSGDVVYVTVRTIWGPTGPNRMSTVRLRRLGRWTDEEREDQAQRARERLSRLASHIE